MNHRTGDVPCGGFFMGKISLEAFGIANLQQKSKGIHQRNPETALKPLQVRDNFAAMSTTSR